ncbi:phage tail spike protein [Gardnerella pickettii]|uniref:Phage minor structural protein n=1 Tax=Gardnerella pickettii JCP8017A TaxID=1261062 RepID=T2PMC8_9BIFI|nr:phage tail spike protein [Gardnerella pickettii]EPI53481.1 phage minor structural protein [Gardnerella pickettii JCP8017A]EPI62375.1 phage minor structural protein [Gardnerella pickettii JCP8017B]
MRFAHISYNGTLKPDITSITKAVSTCAVDGTDTLDITTLDGGVEKNDRILYLDGKGLWHEYIVQSVETQRDEGKPVTTAYCVNSISELGSVYILDKRGHNTTAPERARVALEGTRWTAGTVDNGTIRHYADLNFYHQSVLKSLQDIAKAYGLELETSITVENGKVTARTVNLLEQRGNKNAERRFEYGCDLKSVKRTLMAEQVITRLYAWGKGEEKTDDDGNATGGYSRRIGLKEVNNGKPYLDDVEAQKYWGVLEGDAVFDDCDDRNELLRLAKARLAQVSKPQVSYEAEVVNLGRAGFDPDGVSIGDSVQIVDTTFTPPIRVEGRVLKIDEDLLDSVDATRITLGNIHESYTQKRRAQEQKLDALIAQSDEWNAVAEGNGLYVRDLIGRVNDVMNGVGGYTYFKPGEGIIVYDKPENQHPTRAIQLGGGFWRTANSRKPDGDWDWKNIASGEGIFANAITTGKLMDAAGRNWWDMETGEFSLQASTRVGGKTVQQIVDDSADSVIGKMNESLTQEAIFNKLTNNGQTQGIYLNGGELYLNASYIKSGYLSANIIRAGRIQDEYGNNFWDLGSGHMKVTDATIGGMTISNNAIYNEIMRFDNSGMDFTIGDRHIGAITCSYMKEDSRRKTLAFHLEGINYMTWAWRPEGSTDPFITMMTYSPDYWNGYSKGINFSCDINLRNYSISNAQISRSCWYENGANLQKQQFLLPTTIDQNTGTVREWQIVTFGFEHGFVI